ncbi:hypothetical protein ACR78F_07620 [Sphingobacterium spiritivorum]|uniref:hypothetical protein n=1 Tax=Sphingobacterium spiritivorum TaxID=258 RepID=UPI003DA67AB1
MNFYKPSITDVYKRFLEEARLQILREPESFIIGTTTDQLVQYYYGNKHFQPIELDEELGETANIKNEVRLIRANNREAMYRNDGDLNFEYESISVSIALKPNKSISEILKMRPSQFSLSWSSDEVDWKSDSVTFQIDMKGYGFNRDERQITNMIDQQKQHIYTHINTVSAEIERCNENLKSALTQLVNERKDKLEADKSKYNSLLKQINIPLKRKDDVAVKRIQVDQKPLVQAVRPKPEQPENYVIDRGKVLDIIHIIDNQGLQFEKTPKSFENSGEEDLRNVILVGLNALFEGKATGETFMAKGKTDIYLNITKGNILVCECKIWGGQKHYAETIDQLLNYLTWRENFGIVITFGRNKKFTNILSEAASSIQSHVTYRRGFQVLKQTHLLSQHSLPGDDMKNVELHHLFYNL